jgi:peptide deformylase
MTVLAIRKVPDPVLREVCTRVTVFDADLQRLTDDMLETMYAAPGRGLAAPQVGVLSRIFVMDAGWKTGDPTPMVFVNPDVLAASKTVVTQPEGCLSIPDDLTDVTRPDKVRLRWQDIAGAAHEADFTDFSAACTQHEIDHLDGILITDKPT